MKFRYPKFLKQLKQIVEGRGVNFHHVESAVVVIRGIEHLFDLPPRNIDGFTEKQCLKVLKDIQVELAEMPKAERNQRAIGKAAQIKKRLGSARIVRQRAKKAARDRSLREASTPINA